MTKNSASFKNVTRRESHVYSTESEDRKVWISNHPGDQNPSVPER